MKLNGHRLLAAVFASLGGSAPMLPLPWSVVAAALAAGGAAVLVRPDRVSRRMGRLSASIPGTSVADKRIDEHGTEVAQLMARARAQTGEHRER